MIRAETVFAIFQELPQKEKDRFLQLCNIAQSTTGTKTKRKKPLITDAQATEYLLSKIQKHN